MPDLERPHVRIKCKHTKRLMATITEQGLLAWCKYEKKPELITWDVIDAARARVQEQEKKEAC